MRINLPEEDIPTHYYNISADLSGTVPKVLHPATECPVSEKDLSPLFARELIRQEMSTKRDIKIPDKVREKYKLYRPTPLIRAMQLEKALGTPAHIYFKHEGVSPTGSHKLNTAIAQAYYNKIEGVNNLVTETGAGQWGTALSFACAQFEMKCTVYMVKVSFEQKPYRKSLINAYGADIIASPSNTTDVGKSILAKTPDTPGSLGMAISEAVEVAAKDPSKKYSLGSVLNHVLLHQTIIGQETRKQLEKAGESPDIIIGCVGGGSNFAGISFPFIKDKMDGKSIRFIAVEPKACSSLLSGAYKYDFGDTAKMTPLLKMHTLGCGFVPPPIHAGGLRYHGMAPLISLLYDKGLIEAQAYGQEEVFEAGLLFAKTEGIIPAPESAHAVKAAIEAARECKEKKTIVFNLSGHGHFDLGAYDAYLGKQ